MYEPGRKGVNRSLVHRDEASDLASEADEHRGCQSKFSIGLQPTRKASSNVDHQLPNRLAKWRRDASRPPNTSVMRDGEPEALSKADKSFVVTPRQHLYPQREPVVARIAARTYHVGGEGVTSHRPAGVLAKACSGTRRGEKGGDEET